MNIEKMLIIGNQAKNPITGKSEKVVSINGLKVNLETDSFDAIQILEGEDAAVRKAVTQALGQ